MTSLGHSGGLVGLVGLAANSGGPREELHICVLGIAEGKVQMFDLCE